MPGADFKEFGVKASAAAEVHRAACSPQGTRWQQLAHSGNPAFRRPSIISFEFDCPPRAIHADIVKAGSTSSRRATASSLGVTTEMGKSGRETAVSYRIGGVLSKSLLPCDEGLVK